MESDFPNNVRQMKVSVDRKQKNANGWCSLPTILGQVKNKTMENARILLEIDNAKLAADDFRIK